MVYIYRSTFLSYLSLVTGGGRWWWYVVVVGGGSWWWVGWVVVGGHWRPLEATEASSRAQCLALFTNLVLYQRRQDP